MKVRIRFIWLFHPCHCQNNDINDISVSWHGVDTFPFKWQIPSFFTVAISFLCYGREINHCETLTTNLVRHIDLVEKLLSLSVDAVVHVLHVRKQDIHGVVAFGAFVDVAGQISVEGHPRFGSETAHLRQGKDDTRSTTTSSSSLSSSTTTTTTTVSTIRTTIGTTTTSTTTTATRTLSDHETDF